MNRLTKVLLGLVMLTVLALGFYLLRPAPAQPLTPLPMPNGCDDFARAGQLAGDGSTDYRILNLEQLRSFVSSNVAALQLVREGLKHECRVPTDFSENYISSRTLELPRFKRLALALAAEGKLAEIEGRTNDAARIYLEIIHFSHEFPRGGVIIDRLVGLACEAIGTKPLQQLVPKMSAEDCRIAMEALAALDTRSESAEDVLRHEKLWTRQAFSWKERIGGLIAFKSMQSTKQNFTKKTNDGDKQRRLLLLDLAGRACELEKGKPPGSYADLVPTYLKSVPQDPHTGTNLLYHFR